MSLLTSCNLANPDNAHWVANNGSDAAPVIPGNPVQVGTTGPIVSTLAPGNVNSIVASGLSGTSVLRLGNAGLANCMSFGPGQAATLTSQVTMIPNANLQVGQFTQIIVNPDPTITPGMGSGLLTVNTNGRLEVVAGGIVDFNNAGAQSGTFRETVAVPDIPDTVTQVIANPAGIVEGVYAVMVACGGTTVNQNLKNISTVAYWSGTAWSYGGTVSGPNNLELQPAPGFATLQIVNGTGATLDIVQAKFVLLASGVA